MVQGNVSFSINGILFEYDAQKNAVNVQKHGISLRMAARVFFDYDRIEFYDDEHSEDEERYNTIGDIGTGIPELTGDVLIGNIGNDDIIFVVYTERAKKDADGKSVDVIRLISARYATNFERGIYYGKY